jgi:hypothetical protein
MPWDPAFIEQLLPTGEPRAPRYLLESEAVPAGSPSFGGTLALSSWAVAGYTPLIAARGHAISYGELQVRDWTASRGMLTIALVWTDPANDQRPYTARGQIVTLRVGFSDDTSTFEPVFVGRVRACRWSSQTGRWLLQIEEISGCLTSRFATAASEGALFHDLVSTTLDPFGVVDGHTTVGVVDTTGFRDDGGGVGAFYIADGTDGPFVDTYTGTTATSFTGVTDGALGTDTGNNAAVVASDVAEVAYMVGHPIVVALRLLHSTGAGTNGAYDTLPQSWGYGLPTSLVDQDDAQAFKAIMDPAGGSNDWNVYSVEPQANGLSWMQSWMAPAGMYVTMRQGQITVRCAVLPWLQTTPGHVDISPATGLKSIDSYETWDPTCPMEYSTVEIAKVIDTHASVSNVEDVVHLPDGGTLTRSPTFAALGTAPETLDWRQEIGARIAPWDQRTPERIEMTLAGWWAGQAAPGDTCTLDATLFGLTDRFGNAFDGTRRGLVLSAQPNWFGATTRVVALFLPNDSEEGL